jgi:hypothetical protein
MADIFDDADLFDNLEAPPPSIGVQTSEAIKGALVPERPDDSPNASALIQTGADMFGGYVQMGENLIQGVKNLKNVVLHPIETGKGVVQAVKDNPFTAAGSLFPYAVKSVPGLGMVTAMGGQLIDQSRRDDTRHPADRWGDLFTAGAGPVAAEIPGKVLASKPAQVVKAAAAKVPPLKRAMDAPDLVRGKVAAFAEDKAVHALNPTKQQARMAPPTMGRTLLEEKAIPVFGSPEAIQARVQTAKQAAGEKVGALIDDTHAKLTYQPPPKPIVTPIGSGLKGPHQPGRETPRAWRYEEATAPKPSGKVIDAEVLAASLEGELAGLRNVPGMEGAVGKMEQYLETLRNNKQLTLPDAQKLRQQIDEAINWNKKVPDMPQAQEFLYSIRTRISQKMNDVIGAFEGENALKNANRKYGDLAQADAILDKSIPRGQSNQSISLGDKVAGGVGAAVGGVPGAVVGAAGNKLSRAVGNAMAARAADRLAKKGSPELRGLARVTRGAYLTEQDQGFRFDDQGRLIIDINSPQVAQP